MTLNPRIVPSGSVTTRSNVVVAPIGRVASAGPSLLIAGLATVNGAEDVAQYELRLPVPPLPSRSPVGFPESSGVGEPVGLDVVPRRPGKLVHVAAPVFGTTVAESMLLARVAVMVSVVVVPGATASNVK